MIGWNVPSNNYGKEDGFNDAGIETFLGSPLRSLAREINQNSCDASDTKSGRPVEVHFELLELPTVKFPAKDEFITTLRACEKYWEVNEKTRKFFSNALSIMSNEKISMLKISDFNTTGLTGSDKGHGTDWHNLIKSVGASEKSATSGGSFGIGKHAPFACSGLRTIFYATKDVDGREAFQGVAKLVTHELPNGETTQGTGFFGVKERNEPIKSLSEVDSFFNREKTGTDIYIAGFHQTENWETTIIKYVIEDFFVAIKEGLLIVNIGGATINSTNLEYWMEEYIYDDEECLADKYYKALTHTTRHSFNGSIDGLGPIELHLLPGKGYPKRVAMIRKTGMVIYHKGHFRTPLKFCGVLIAKDDKANAFLRSLEPPSHAAWEPERHENPPYASIIIKKIYSWINECLKSLAHYTEEDQLDAEGMAPFLPDDFDESEDLDENKKDEDKKGKPKEIELETRKSTLESSSDTTGHKTESGDEEGATDGDGEKENTGDGGETPTDGGGGGGSGDGGSKSGEGGKHSKKRIPINLENVRAFCADIDTGTYIVSFTPIKDGNGYIKILIAGEDGEEIPQIKSAKIANIEQQLSINNKCLIGPIDFKRKEKQIFEVTLEDSLRCALEVSAYEDKL